jgi:hypothetical protein
MGSGCIDPHFLDLGTSWRWVVSFTPRPLYPRGKSTGTHWIGGSINPRDGLVDFENKKFLILPGLELRPLRRLDRSQSLYRLRYPGTSISVRHISILSSHLFLGLIRLFCSQLFQPMHAYLFSYLQALSAHSSWFDHRNNNWRRAEVIKLLIMQLLLASCHFISSSLCSFFQPPLTSSAPQYAVSSSLLSFHQLLNMQFILASCHFISSSLCSFFQPPLTSSAAHYAVSSNLLSLHQLLNMQFLLASSHFISSSLCSFF